MRARKRKLVQSERIDGPHGERVYVRFYADGAVRFGIRGNNAWRVDQTFFAPGKPTFSVTVLPHN